MAIAYRDVSAMGSGTTSLVLTTPATVQAGDVLVAFIGDKATSGSTSAPTGWTWQNGAPGGSGRIQVFTAIVGQGGVTANQATTFSGLTTSCIGAMTAYSGVDQNTPLDVGCTVRSNATGATGANGLSTVTPADWIELAFISLASGSTWSSPGCATNPTAANVTQRINAASGSTMSILIAGGMRNPSTPGGTGNSSATMGTAGVNAGAIVALRSAVVATLNTSDSVTASDFSTNPTMVAFRDVSAMGSGTTSLTLTVPSTVQTNDVLIALVADMATGGSIAAPSGWTFQGSGANAQGRFQLYTAIAGQGGVTASSTFSLSGLVTNCIGAILAHSGCDLAVGSSFFDVGVNVTVHPSGSVGASQLIISSQNAYVVAGFIALTSGSTWSGAKCNTAPTSMTDRLNVANGTTNSIYLADAVKTPRTPGATGASTATMGTAGPNVGVLIALRPAGTVVAPIGASSSTAVGTVSVTTTVGVSVTVALTGVALGAASGTTTPTGGAAVAPIGTAASFAEGTPVISGGVSITPLGQSLVSAVGSAAATAAVNVTPTGNAIAAALGTSTETSTVVVAPTGLALTSTAGHPAVSTMDVVAVTGLTVGMAVGTVQIETDTGVVLSGVSIAASSGTVDAEVLTTVAVVGCSLTALVGSATAYIPGNVEVTGCAISCQTGILAGGPIPNRPITGGLLWRGYQLHGGPGGYRNLKGTP